MPPQTSAARGLLLAQLRLPLPPPRTDGQLGVPVAASRVCHHYLSVSGCAKACVALGATRHSISCVRRSSATHPQAPDGAPLLCSAVLHETQSPLPLRHDRTTLIMYTQHTLTRSQLAAAQAGARRVPPHKWVTPHRAPHPLLLCMWRRRAGPPPLLARAGGQRLRPQLTTATATEPPSPRAPARARSRPEALKQAGREDCVFVCVCVCVCVCVRGGGGGQGRQVHRQAQGASVRGGVVQQRTEQAARRSLDHSSVASDAVCCPTPALTLGALELCEARDLRASEAAAARRQHSNDGSGFASASVPQAGWSRLCEGGCGCSKHARTHTHTHTHTNTHTHTHARTLARTAQRNTCNTC
jgi:hypothetical protein